ncbi:MAG: hypothetical protein AB7J32_16080 [Pseudonocardia sp.]
MIAAILARLGPDFGGAVALVRALCRVPVVLLAGSVFHERAPVALAPSREDWLVTLLVVTAIV